MVYTQENSEKPYIFSISCYESLVELHDIDTGEYHTIQTKHFYGDARIFSWRYSLFEIGNTHTYVLAAVISCGYNNDNKEKSNINIVKKFQINSFSSTNMYKELASVKNENNDNVRIISIFRIDPAEIIILFFVDSSHKLTTYFYDDDLNYLNKTEICTLQNIHNGFGHFVRALYLKE